MPDARREADTSLVALAKYRDLYLSLLVFGDVQEGVSLSWNAQ